MTKKLKNPTTKTTLPMINGLNMIRKLGEGGQGAVFLVQKNRINYALKLYSQQCATPEQRAIIQHLVDSGAPNGPCKDKFAWPLEIIDYPEENCFGYLMPFIDSVQYVEVTDIESGKVPLPSYRILILACIQLAECFRELHIEGLCYQDISKANFLLSLENGDIMICDNDNVVIDKSGDGNIRGTLQYMAPEVARGNARPSTVTDQHSLSALLFMLLCGGHPLHGEIEFNIRIFDGVAAKYLYGDNPVFVFDPKDRSNRLPNEPGYRHILPRWKTLPSHIRGLFTRAFTKGLHNPAARVTDIEWKHALSQLMDYRHVCGCGAENFWDPHIQEQQTCWHRNCSLTFPPKIYIQGKITAAMLAKPGQSITTMHLGEKSSISVIAETEPHPTDNAVTILRNKSGMSWTVSYGAEEMVVPTGRAIPLHPCVEIKAPNFELTVYP